MSGSNRQFVLAYIFLVILPLVALAGILKAGKSVSAPVSIDGTWNLRFDSAQIDTLPCGKALTVKPATIAIAQSGKTFVLSFPGGPKLAATGTLEGTMLHASLVEPAESREGQCAAGSQLALLASVDKRVDSSLLTGTLSAPNCPSCASVGFQAERQVPASSRGGR